jgi:hypothetical protein
MLYRLSYVGGSQSQPLRAARPPYTSSAEAAWNLAIVWPSASPE